MDAIHELRRDLRRFRTALRIESAIAVSKAQHRRNPVAIVQFEKERADDVVETRAQSTARHDAGACLPWVKEEIRTKTSQFEVVPGPGPDFDPFWNADVVANRVAARRSEAWFRRG
jgi:hypothetical protein